MLSLSQDLFLLSVPKVRLEMGKMSFRYAVLPYLSELFHPYTPAQSFRSADQLLLVVPKSKRKLRGDRAFSIAVPKMWNNLSLHGI